MNLIDKPARKILLLWLSCLGASVAAMGQALVCPARPAAGSVVADPVLLSSIHGALTLSLTMASSVGPDGVTRYCYLYGDGGAEAPTLMVKPGDVLTIDLINSLGSGSPADMRPDIHIMGPGSKSPDNPCLGESMTSTSTNIHFHGLNIPPVCHQDDVIQTSIAAGSPPFRYRITIPLNEPPGLYWYHPHPHGFTKTQIVGGASGALIVGGVENQIPEVAGLPQRVFVIRQQQLPSGGDENSVLSVNFVPFQELTYARILIAPLEKQLWRLVNSSATQFLNLQVLNQGAPTNFQIVGLDGVPLSAARTANAVVIPPAGRAEIVVQGPPADGLYQLFNAGYDTGPIGDANPAALLANIVPSASAPAASNRVPARTRHDHLRRFAGLNHATPNTERNLYFTENGDGTKFFITVRGQRPKVYDPTDPPAIVTQQGAIEDWTLENRTQEVHAFHLHQLHFLVLSINGVPTNDDAVRDTIVIPYWNGTLPYPSVKIRVDFRDPETVGTFLYHCHILDHEDLGMMAKIQVKPAN
jgi:FtsP/CotA-like multicopper oxidase with cupredoxin domain